MVEEVVGEVVEQVWVLWAEEAIMDLVYSQLQFWVGFVVLPGMVPFGGGGGGERGQGGTVYNDHFCVLS